MQAQLKTAQANTRPKFAKEPAKPQHSETNDSIKRIGKTATCNRIGCPDNYSSGEPLINKLRIAHLLP